MSWLSKIQKEFWKYYSMPGCMPISCICQPQFIPYFSILSPWVSQFQLLTIAPLQWSSFPASGAYVVMIFLTASLDILYNVIFLVGLTHFILHTKPPLLGFCRMMMLKNCILSPFSHDARSFCLSVRRMSFINLDLTIKSGHWSTSFCNSDGALVLRCLFAWGTPWETNTMGDDTWEKKK